MRAVRTRAATAVLLTLSLGTVAGCTDGETVDLSPDETLEQAKKNLDDTPGLRIELTGDGLPKTVRGLLTAEGIGTHDPAFEGDIKVIAEGGLTANAKVIAAEGEVFAVLPFQTDYVEIDPGNYGAPDPAALMNSEKGLSSLLTAVEDVEEGEDTRDGDVVLSKYTGTLPGEVVATIIPSASADEDFDATFTINDDNQLTSAELAGPFYPKVDDVTYTIDFSEYGTEKDIQPPTTKQ